MSLTGTSVRVSVTNSSKVSSNIILWCKLHRNALLFTGIFLLGIFLRVYKFPSIPAGIYQDEANASYEAYSLLRTGADKWGYHFPIYFVSWGSGQNVMQSYLSIPFVAIFGLNTFSTRIVPLLLGILSIPLAYFAANKIYNSTVGLLAELFVVIAPWHIMLSRWAVESDISPFFMLLSVVVWVYTFENDRYRKFIPFVLVPFALSFYTYALDAIPILLMIIGFIWLYRADIKQEWRRFLVSCIIFLAISSPFFVFLAINFLHISPNNALAWLPISIPVLPTTRLAQVNTYGWESNLALDFLFILLGFEDGLPWDSIQGFLPLGLFYIPCMVPLFIMALKKFHSKKNLLPVVWILATASLFFIAPVNGIRGNAIFFPLLLLCALAVWYISQSIHKIRYQRLFILIAVCLSLFYSTVFSYVYFTNQNQYIYSDFNVGFDTALSSAISNHKPGEPILISDKLRLSYVYTIFYAHVDPADFQKHVIYHTKDGVFVVEQYRDFIFNADNVHLKQSPSYVAVLKTDDVNCAHPQIIMKQGQWTVERCYD